MSSPFAKLKKPTFYTTSSHTKQDTARDTKSGPGERTVGDIGGFGHINEVIESRYASITKDMRI
jgi:hypothetical protein